MAVTDATVVIVDGETIDSVAEEAIAQREIAQHLLTQAKGQGVSLTGPGGSLSQPTKNVVEIVENVELTEHLGREYGEALSGREHAQRDMG